MTTPARSVILFESVSATLLAEKTLRANGIPHKVIPVPKHISSDCGVCIRVNEDGVDQAVRVLEDKVRFLDIRRLP